MATPPLSLRTCNLGDSFNGWQTTSPAPDGIHKVGVIAPPGGGAAVANERNQVGVNTVFVFPSVVCRRSKVEINGRRLVLASLAKPGNLFGWSTQRRRTESVFLEPDSGRFFRIKHLTTAHPIFFLSKHNFSCYLSYFFFFLLQNMYRLFRTTTKIQYPILYAISFIQGFMGGGVDPSSV